MTSCIGCGERPALACDECRRALAMLDRPLGFGSAARQPEQGTDCRLCERGAAALCVECLCAAVLDARGDPRGPYAPLDGEQFEVAEGYARQEAEGARKIGGAARDLATASMYDRRPAQAGPSWYRTIGAPGA